jgi:hypothetical protein
MVMYGIFRVPEYDTDHLVLKAPEYSGDIRLQCRICGYENRMECARGRHYKLRMMGVQLMGPTYIYGDNMSVVHNTQHPESMLKKRSNSICYHAIRERVAMGESLTAHIQTEMNPADLRTKIMSGGQKHKGVVNLVLYNT